MARQLFSCRAPVILLVIPSVWRGISFIQQGACPSLSTKSLMISQWSPQSHFSLWNSSAYSLVLHFHTLKTQNREYCSWKLYCICETWACEEQTQSWRLYTVGIKATVHRVCFHCCVFSSNSEYWYNYNHLVKIIVKTIQKHSQKKMEKWWSQTFILSFVLMPSKFYFIHSSFNISL